ncbi:MAG: UbiA prenyltransferase family protein [Polyangiaceae bacterium]
MTTSEEAQDDADTSSPPPATGKPSTFKLMLGVVRMMRPHQWVKNTFVLAPVFFAKDIFHVPLLLTALEAFAVFCFLAGAVYTLNDLVDVEADRAHPVKRNRPIASGLVPESLAKAVGGVLIVGSLGGAFALSIPFGATALAYLVNNVAYSFKPTKLKDVAYVDVGSISLGFVLRVVAGGLATQIPVSTYLVACTALLALFLGFGKRRHELAQHLAKEQKKEAARIAAGEPAQANDGKVAQRGVLRSYSTGALTAALSITALATVGTYLMYTLDPQTRVLFQSDMLWATTVFPVIGMGRFLQLVIGDTKSESPTQKMLSDVPFILNLVLWIIVVVIIVYRVTPGVG